MSGGVDSSVAAALLKEQGHDVLGVTMKLLDTKPQDAASCKSCCGYDASRDAKLVADEIGIPHYTVNAVDIFKETVIDDFMSEYACGRTPNPCVRCNQFVKFDYLMKKADELDCEFLATGHYAIREGQWLYRGKDPKKDQAYFLYVVYGTAFNRVLFPLGTMIKDEIRSIASNLHLITAHKPESQDICFVPDGDYSALLSKGKSAPPGPIIDTAGNVVGRHTGIHCYTIGQRKGLGAFGTRMFVKEIRVDENAIVVGTEEDLATNFISVTRMVWAPQYEIPLHKHLEVQVRYRSRPVKCKIVRIDKTKAEIEFTEPVRAVAAGQSAVIYDGEMVVGGGIIERAGKEGEKP